MFLSSPDFRLWVKGLKKKVNASAFASHLHVVVRGSKMPPLYYLVFIIFYLLI